MSFTTISSFELFLGAHLSKNRDKNIEVVQNLVQELPVIPFTIKGSYIASTIYADLLKRGEMIELNDIYIASIALEHDAAHTTDNIDHFNRISNLKIINI